MFKELKDDCDLQGRGNLGFSRVDKKDVTRGITSTQWFGKTWPNIGVVTYSSASDANGLMSTVSQTPAVAVIPLFNDGTSNSQPAWQANGLSTVCPYVGSKTDTEYDNGPEASATTTVVNSLDAWCNPTSVTATVSGDGNSYPTTTSTNFTNDTGHWLMGEATQVAVTKTRGSSVIIRTTAATFDPTTGALATTTVEPSDPTTGLTLKLVTTYDRTKSDGTTPNPFGLLRKTTQTWQHPIKNVAVTRVAKARKLTISVNDRDVMSRELDLAIELYSKAIEAGQFPTAYAQRARAWTGKHMIYRALADLQDVLLADDGNKWNGPDTSVDPLFHLGSERPAVEARRDEMRARLTALGSSPP